MNRNAFIVILFLGVSLATTGYALESPGVILPAAAGGFDWASILPVLSGVAGVVLVSAVKPWVAKGDSAIAGIYKSFQPAVAAGLGIFLPMLGNVLGVTDLPPADVVATAPLGTIFAVGLREAMSKLRKIKF